MEKVIFVKQIIERTKLTLEESLTSNEIAIEQFEISTKDLDPKFFDYDIRNSIEFLRLFDHLKHSGPVLYWFEITNDISGKEIIASVKKFATLKERATPALRPDSKINFDSKVLYVGKVKSNSTGRIVVHLGFSKSGKTQGLQLFHWAKELPLHLRLNVIKFHPNMAEIMGVLENYLAKEFKPLIGKHQ